MRSIWILILALAMGILTGCASSQTRINRISRIFFVFLPSLMEGRKLQSRHRPQRLQKISADGYRPVPCPGEQLAREAG